MMIDRWQLLRETPRILYNPLRYMQQLIARHGSVVGADFGSLQAFVVADPAVIEHVLVENQRNYSKQTPQFEAFRAVTGNGLLNSDGAYWRRQRRLIQPAFHRRALEPLTERMVAHIAARADRWRSDSAYRRPVDIEHEMWTLSLAIICDTLFDLPIGDRAADQLVETVAQALSYVMFQAQVPLPGATRLPLPVVRRFRPALAELDRFVYDLIATRRAAGPRDDLLSMLLFSIDAETGEPLDDVAVRDEILTLIVAGYETVATGLTWAFYLLDQHPAVAQQLRAEVAAHVGSRAPGLADLANLPTARTVFEETLRLYPPSWLISRKAVGADAFAGYDVPAGSLIIISPYVVHHYAGNWPDPDAFCPQRFLSSAHARHAYIPFGAGPRLCIGNRFAEMEAQLVLATLLPQFDLSYTGKPPARVTTQVTIRPRGGMPMWITPLR